MNKEIKITLFFLSLWVVTSLLTYGLQYMYGSFLSEGWIVMTEIVLLFLSGVFSNNYGDSLQ